MNDAQNDLIINIKGLQKEFRVVLCEAPLYPKGMGELDMSLATFTHMLTRLAELVSTERPTTAFDIALVMTKEQHDEYDRMFTVQYEAVRERLKQGERSTEEELVQEWRDFRAQAIAEVLKM